MSGLMLAGQPADNTSDGGGGGAATWSRRLGELRRRLTGKPKTSDADEPLDEKGGGSVH